MAFNHRVGRGYAIGLFFALVLSLAGTPAAEAATIKSYTFFQGGYEHPNPVFQSGSVTGSFTGEVDASGIMTAAGLTAFHIEATVDFGNGTFISIGNIGMPTYFSFDTTSPPNSSGGNSTLHIAAPSYLFAPTSICVGFQTALTCGVTGNGYAFGFRTFDFPKMTLVSTTVTPIPAPILLFGTALAALGAAGFRARRRARLSPSEAA